MEYDGSGARRVEEVEAAAAREEGVEREPGQLEGCWLQCARAGCRKWRLVAKDCLPALRGDGFGQAASARRVDERYACWRSWLDGSAERYADWVEAHGRAGNQNVVRFGAVGPESGNEAAVAAGGMGQGGWGVRPSAAEGAGRQEDKKTTDDQSRRPAIRWLLSAVHGMRR